MLRVFLLIFLWLSSSVGAQDSKLPDDDKSGFNNSFETAQDLGSLVQSDNNTPIPVSIPGELGIVFTGNFDTFDYYKFALPLNNWAVRIRLSEDPKATMFVPLYDERRNEKNPGVGSDEENYTITLAPGRYFLKVGTSKDVAKNRKLKYVLSIEPTLVRVGDGGGTSCTNAPLVGGNTNAFALQGTLDRSDDQHWYRTFMPGSGRPSFFGAGKNFSIGWWDALGQRWFRITPEDKDKISVGWFDPGHYCLLVHDLRTQGPANYKLSGNLLASPYRPPAYPGGARLADFDVGDGNINGMYGDQRYINGPGTKPETLEFGHVYNIREWVQAGQTHGFAIALDAPAKVRIEISGISAPIRGRVEEAGGRLVGTTQPTGQSMNPLYMTPEVFVGILPRGRYRLALEQLGSTAIGSGYTLRVESEKAAVVGEKDL